MIHNDIETFFALLRGGLWEKEVPLSQYGEMDYLAVFQLSDEQSVIGLITAGLDYVKDVTVPQEDMLTFIGSSLQLEQSNLAMNQFIADLVLDMRKKGIYTLLLKGQGIAQCYERPLWRANGDVDFFLSDENYQKAKKYLLPLASSVDPEGLYGKHLGLTIKEWVVELHGRLRCGLSSKVDNVLDEIQKDTFYGGNIRSWDNNGTEVYMLDLENDVFYVFTHFLGHFYKGGIGLRQVCDWCRLMWENKNKLKTSKLESHIKASGLLSEWRAFAAFAVEYLGMPVEALPLYSADAKWKRKARRIRDFILMSGNFGNNRDMSYYERYPYVVRKCISMGRRIGDLCRHARIFPVDSLRFSFCIMYNGLMSAVRGE